jgi:protein-disulfide isomerase
MKTKFLTIVVMMAMIASAAWAVDTSVLRPPAGARMAIVVFEDLQCPSCGKVDPLLLQAERNYNIPLVRHDFPLPAHNWSMEAHIMARYFDTISPSLGEEFRRSVFANQSSIYKTNLRQFADKFAADHHIALPAFYDPDGTLRNKVMADAEVGKGLAIHQTPTIYIVSDSQQTPYVEVADQGKLFETIEQVKSALGPAPASAAKAKPKPKK